MQPHKLDTTRPKEVPQQSKSNINSILRWLLPLFILVISYCMQRSVALLGLDLHHDTLMFDAARRTLHGEIPFRDFFYQYNLGTVFLHVLALKIFGEYIASLKIATAIAYAFIALLIYACAAFQGRLWQGLALALTWATLSPFYMPVMNGFHAWSTVYMMTSIMCGALCLLLSLRFSALLLSVLAGICFNLAFWFKQVAGIQILFVLVWIAINAWKSKTENKMTHRFRIILVGYSLGGLISALPFLLYLNYQLIFPDWWRSAFVFNGLFATSGQSSSGLAAFIRTLFPITRDIGYLSRIWAILPIYLLMILAKQCLERNQTQHEQPDSAKHGVSLFISIGLAGWIQYFPLSHAFHTQLFMAPVFVLIALNRIHWTKDWSQLLNNKRQLFITTTFILTVAIITYESFRHLRGFCTKIKKPMVTLLGNSPIKGLKLSPDNAKSFDTFYSAFVKAKHNYASSVFVPMSVDPLRALLPNCNSEPALFKMGLNWTWPNEIVEPGFNKLLTRMIAERKSPVYADSLIAIPGYIPIALLEMQSPVTKTHTLYIPSANITAKEAPSYKLNALWLLNESDFYPTERRDIRLIPADSLFALNLGKLLNYPLCAINQLHITFIKKSDVTFRLTELQYEKYLSSIPTALANQVKKLYKKTEFGDKPIYKYIDPIKHDQLVFLMKFQLDSGKLFKDQDRPRYSSTLMLDKSAAPFLVKLQANNKVNVVWKNSINLIAPDRQPKRNDILLVIPNGEIDPNEDMLFFIQVVAKDNTEQSFFMFYSP